MGLSERFVGLAEPQISLAERLVGLAEPEISVAEWLVGLAEPEISVAEWFMGLAEPQISVAERLANAYKSFRDTNLPLIETNFPFIGTNLRPIGPHERLAATPLAPRRATAGPVPGPYIPTGQTLHLRDKIGR